MSRSWLILGCGYVGRALASHLLGEGCAVTVTSRRESKCEKLAQSLAGAIAMPYSLGDTLEKCSRFSVVVICAPPGAGSPKVERLVAEQLRPGQRLLYLSTTGVYRRADGREVADDFPVGPSCERSRLRLDVERALRSKHTQSVSLRIPGIYGPWRGVHQRVRSGTYRLLGAGGSVVSRIYVSDLVAAIALLGGTKAPLHAAYVVGDELPTTSAQHAAGICALLDQSSPESISEFDVSPAVRAMLGAGRRVVPLRLYALGWRARFPTWREGLEEALRVESLDPSASAGFAALASAKRDEVDT